MPASPLVFRAGRAELRQGPSAAPGPTVEVRGALTAPQPRTERPRPLRAGAEIEY